MLSGVSTLLATSAKVVRDYMRSQAADAPSAHRRLADVVQLHSMADRRVDGGAGNLPGARPLPPSGEDDLPALHDKPLTSKRALPPAEQDDDRLRVILNRNHEAEGYDLGLTRVSNEALQQAIEVLRQQLDCAIEGVISSRVAHGFTLKLMENRVANDGEAAQNLRVALAHNERRIELLEAQRVKARDGQGWFGKVEAAFTAGFKRGQDDKINVDSWLV